MWVDFGEVGSRSALRSMLVKAGLRSGCGVGGVQGEGGGCGACVCDGI